MLKMEVDGAKDVSQANQLMNLRKVRKRSKERWNEVVQRGVRGEDSTITLDAVITDSSALFGYLLVFGSKHLIYFHLI